MKAKVNFNQNSFELFMQTIPAITAIFDLGFIPREEEVREFTEELYALHLSKTGVTQRPLYTVITEDSYLGNEKVIETMLPQDLPKIFKGIYFFKRYAKTHKIPESDRRRVFDHALKNAPNLLKEGTQFAVEKKERDDDELFNNLMDFLAAGLDKDDVFKMDVEDDEGNKFNKSFIPAYAKNVPSKIMTYEEFKRYIINALSQIFNDEENMVKASFSLRTTEEKHEAVHVVGKKKGATWSNGFLIEPFYEAYTLGKPLGETVLEMLKSIEENDEWISKVNMNELNDFETAKNSLMIRLINYAEHKDILEKHIFKIVGDVAMVAYMFVMQNDSGMSSYKIGAAKAKDWNLSEEFILNYAIENTARLFRPYIIPIEAFNFSKATAYKVPDQNRFFMEDNFKLPLSMHGAFSLFQEDGLNDATIVFYKGAMHRIATLLDDDLYIIMPETDYAVVHAKKRYPNKQLKKLFKLIKNRTPQNEILSEKIYLYSRADDSLSVAFE